MIWALLAAMYVYAALPLQELGWVDNPNTSCLGFFVLDEPIQGPSLIEVQSAETSVWDGSSWVFSHPLDVRYENTYMRSQSGRWLIDQNAWMLEGQTRMLHPPLRLIAQKGYYIPRNREAELEDVVFRLGPTPQYHWAIWGEAGQAHWQDSTTVLQGVHLSICSPRRSLWGLRAKEAVFYHQKEQLMMRHVWAYLLGIPVFYLPWLDINLLRERESGLLSPQIYFNRGLVFATVPVYWNIAPYADLTVSPLLSIQNQLGGMGQARYLSPWGYSELGGVILRDGSETRYRIKSELEWVGDHAALEMFGYQVSDGSFVEDYPRFSQNIPWLIPWSARARLQTPYMTFASGFDSFQDFSPEQEAAVFGYYRRLPWVSFASYYPWQGVLWHSLSKYVRALPTASYEAALPGAAWWAQHGGGRYVVYSQTGVWNILVDQALSAVASEGLSSTSSTRGLVQWQQGYQYQGLLIQPKVGFVWGSKMTDFKKRPWLNARPIPWSYDQLFRFDRFSEETILGDYQDIDWSLEALYEGWTLGVGAKYAPQLHEVSIDGITVYDPLLTQHFSPLLTLLAYESGPWRVRSTVNWGRDSYFQYQNECIYEDSRARLGLYGFRLPIDYPAYTTVDSVVPVDGLGVLWGIDLSQRWRLDGEWYTQMDQGQSGYKLALRYHDCCLQSGVGVKRSLLPLESQSPPRTQWFAELNFDTTSSMVDTVLR